MEEEPKLTLDQPKTTWQWHVFGDGLMVVNLTVRVPIWRRVLTRLFFGSRWIRLG